MDIGAARGRELAAAVLRDLRASRMDRGLGGQDVARAIGISPAQYSRIERGLTKDVSIELAATIAATVGCELSVRVHPAGEPIRDTAHAALIERFRTRLHRTLRIRTEVPFPGPSDRRAWDVVVSGAGWRVGVEAETRPRDLQALERRLALKARDGDVTHLVLLLLDSRHNRDLVRAHRDTFLDRFPVPAPRALELLQAGADPGGGALLIL